MAEITALSLVNNLNTIYDEFTEAVKSLGAKNKKGGKKVGQSLVHWLAGSHVRTERDVLCDKFYADVQSFIEVFNLSLEGIDPREEMEACGAIVDILSTPVPGKSNATTDLMKRAMIRLAIPYLPKLSAEDLMKTKERIETAYVRSERLPVEKDVLKEIDKLLHK